MSKQVRDKILLIRRSLRLVGGICAGALFVIEMAPHLFPHALVLRSKKHSDATKQVPHDYYNILKDAAAKIHVDNPGKIKLYVTSELYPTHAGSPYLPNGAVIGIPENSILRSPDDVMNNITYKNQPINWQTKGGKILLSNLQMSDANISFILANKLARMKNFDYLLNAVAAPCWFFSTVELIKRALKKQAKKASPSSIPLVFCVVGGVSFCAYIQLRFLLQFWSQNKADEMAGRCDWTVLNGGLDYFIKRMRVNQVMKALIEDTDGNQYSEYGDDYSSTEGRLSKRLKKLDDIAEAMKDKLNLTSEDF